MAGRIQAAYMLAPLVMDLADKKIPVKIVSLGHRSGAVIMVRTDSPYQKLQGPHRQARRHPQPLRGRFPVPAQDAGAGRHDAEGHRDRRDGAARHAGGAVRQGGGRLLHRRAVRRGRAARRLRAAAAHDARRMAQLHLLRADGARGADQGEPPAGAGPGQPRAGRGPLAGPGAGQPQQGGHDRRRPQVLQPGPEHHPLRDGKSDRPRDLRRPAHDPRRSSRS